MIIFSIVLLFLVSVYKLLVLNKDIEKLPKNIQLGDLTNNTVNKKNCVNSTYYCKVDLDCSDICGTLFICNKDTFTCDAIVYNESEIKDTTNCDAKHGSFLSLAVDQYRGSYWTCIQKYPNLFEPTETLRKHVCNGGVFNVNVLEKTPTIQDCQCKNKDLVYKIDDPNTPRCATKQQTNIFSSLVH